MATIQKNLTKKSISPDIVKANTKAIKIFQSYKKSSSVVERTYTILGRNQSYKSEVGSTLNFKVNNNAVCSTRSKKI